MTTPTHADARVGARSFPAAPLHERVRAYAAARQLDTPDLARHWRIPERTLRRTMSLSRLRSDVADEMACALGLHPCLIWPQWFR